MKYELKAEYFDRVNSPEILYGELSLAEDKNYHILEKKLIESGIDAEDIDVDDWFNENADDECEYSAREFYNPTISRDDIEVTVKGDYVAELGGDTFFVHVEDVWDELYHNVDAINLAKYNQKLGQEYMDKYFSKDVDEDFKEKFESTVRWACEGNFGYEPAKLREVEPDEYESDIQLVIDDNHINWTTEFKEEN